MSEHHTLSELASLTGVTARTIRSWISRDLLPGPIGRGRGASYDDDHRARIETIVALRSHGHSLDDIRQRLTTTPLDELRTRGAGLHAATDATSGETAVDYLLSLASISGPRDDGPTPARRLRNVLEEGASRPPEAKVKPANWVRLAITDDIEIHVRDRGNREHLHDLARVADLLRAYLTGRA